MTHHDLKTVQPYFGEVEAGRKTFEVRHNDRDYQVGDRITLREWVGVNVGAYTGAVVEGVITYVLQGLRWQDTMVIAEGWCVFGFSVIDVPDGAPV